jgi:alanine racemase
MTRPKQPDRRALDLMIRPTHAEIDLTALEKNVSLARRLSPGAQLMVVVKANAYGHGAILVARALEQAGVQFLGVALIEEGVELRNAGVTAPILVLSGSYEGGYQQLLQHQLIPTIFRVDHLVELAKAAKRAGRSVIAHLKVDTGMGRIGVLPEELGDFLDHASRHPEVELDGLLSHFASADLADPAFTREQLQRFRRAYQELLTRGIRPRWRHISNSAAVMDLPEARDGDLFNLARPGLMIYGLSPTDRFALREQLHPALCWKTKITHLKEVAAGTPISYGGTWKAPRRSVIATLPVGYADGYSRRFSSAATVLVRGRRAKIAGRVCMDLCMADVTEVPGVRIGDEVVLIGRQQGEYVSAEELAALAGTISYEVLCGIGARVPRIPAPQ